MSNYPDDIAQYDNDPRSPCYNGDDYEDEDREAEADDVEEP